MKVALLYPKWTGAYGLVGYFAGRNPFPPLNLALLGGILEEKGHDVVIIDGEASNIPMDKMVKAAIGEKPDLIGMSCYGPFFHINKDLATNIKKENPKIPIAIGGPHITIQKELVLDPKAFDYLFIGEAEVSFPQMIETYERGGDLSEVHGIIFRRNGELVKTGVANPFSDMDKDEEYPLDHFPFAARHLLPMEKYKIGTLHGRKQFHSIQTMRGCPWKCIFCASEDLKTTRVIKRSPRSVVKEIKSVVENFNTRHFYIIDDVMTLWPEHITEICDILDEENLSITFEGSTRANLVTDKLIKRLARSGLIRLSFGLETVDSEMRKTMKKKVPLQYYINSNRILNKYNVEAINSVMIGLPGETKENIEKTLSFLENHREIKQANFAITVPYPGTELYEMAISGKHGMKLLTGDFSEYRRYGSAVMQVNDLSPDDLIDFQNEGFVRIYAKPWRWKSVIGKYGIIGGALTILRVAKLILSKIIGKSNAKKIKYGVITKTGVKFDNKEEPVSVMSFSDAPSGHMGSPKDPHFL